MNTHQWHRRQYFHDGVQDRCSHLVVPIIETTQRDGSRMFRTLCGRKISILSPGGGRVAEANGVSTDRCGNCVRLERRERAA